jgi:hypothetical protein
MKNLPPFGAGFCVLVLVRGWFDLFHSGQFFFQRSRLVDQNRQALWADEYLPGIETHLEQGYFRLIFFTLYTFFHQ